MASIYIETHGCQMNEADSQDIVRHATAAGYTVTADPAAASVVVLNTCTVRDNAETRAYGRMQHFHVLKLADPTIKVVVCGCLAEQDRDRLAARAPHVDAVFGTSEIAQLGETLAAWRDQFGDGEEYSDERALIDNIGGTQADGITDEYSHLRAFVTVQRGCSYYCTFCIVPYVRGRFDHRPMQAIVDEARTKLAAGAREVMLVGQTVNAWREPADGRDFGALCRAVAALDGLDRLSFISPHPKDFTEPMIAALAELPQMSARVHLPLQSASDPMLRRMNRKYTIAQYLERVAAFRRYAPHWAITTDLIVGFPGETEEDFLATLALCETGLFAQAYMFVYSPRRGTPAAHFEQVPAGVANERFRRLAAAQDAACRRYHDRKVGTVVRALIQGSSKKDRTKLAAKTSDNVTVIAPMPPGYDPSLYAREPWIDVRVEAAFVWGCAGTMVGRAARAAGDAVPVQRPLLDLIAAR